MNVIAIDTESLNKTSSGAITGRIWFEVKGIKYPDSSWDDFVVVVLLWWLKEVCQNSVNYTFRFMDGPYEIRGYHIDTNNFKLKFLELRVHTNIVEFTTIIDFITLKNSIISAAKLLVQACSEKNYSNDDLLNLEQELLKYNC